MKIEIVQQVVTTSAGIKRVYGLKLDGRPHREFYDETRLRAEIDSLRRSNG